MNRRTAPYLFLVPFLLIFTVFNLYPILRSLILSTQLTIGPQATRFVGIENLTFLLGDGDFWIAVWNTVVFAVTNVVLMLPLSLGLALLLNNQRLRGRSIFRFIFFSPHLMGLVFAALLFWILFQPEDGLINNLLDHAFGFTGIDFAGMRWLMDARFVLPAVILVNLWLYTGFNMIYFLAALQGIDKDLYEAARLDGASEWAQFWHVTLPGIKHVTVFVLVLSTIGSLQLFELPWLLLRNSSGPGQSGLTIVMYLYQNGFVNGDLGYASCIGWTLTLGVMVVSLTQIRLSGTMREGA